MESPTRRLVVLAAWTRKPFEVRAVEIDDEDVVSLFAAGRERDPTAVR